MNILRLAAAAAASLMLSAGADAARTAQQQLLDAYLELSVVQLIPVQAQSFARDLPEGDVQQINRAAHAWTQESIGSIRGRISTTFGDRARPAFEQFVAAFTAAESREDAAYLQRLCANAGLPAPWPANYTGLRKSYIEAQLAGTIARGSSLLGEVQTWADLRRRGVAQTPDLASWLTRGEPVPAAPATPPPDHHRGPPARHGSRFYGRRAGR